MFSERNYYVCTTEITLNKRPEEDARRSKIDISKIFA